MVNVEIVYIAADKTIIHRRLFLTPGATVGDALKESGLLATNPEVVSLPMGIFSRQVSLDTPLNPGDRIEIYRLLTLDPKEKRRQRAKAKD